jgi:hypothetical protein
MFAPPVAKAKTRAGAKSTGVLAPHRSTFAARPFGGSAVEQVHVLQRSVGNQATLRLLAQPGSSLTDGHCEQEAVPASLTACEAAPNASWDFSSIPTFPPDRANQPQTRSLLSAPRLPGVIQPKLVVGQANDPLEHEADRAADRIMRMPTRETPRGPSWDFSRIPAHIFRPAEKPSAVPISVERALTGPGRPLEPALRSDMERRFGHDFSRVQIHTDGAAQQSARDIGARAYTVGEHTVFGAGQFAPGTSEGRRLIAHELSHFVQQSMTGRVRRLVQRFEEGEHKGIGDAATGQRTIFLAPDLPVSYGDIVALAGDYFGDWATLRRLANTQGITEGTRGEVWYAVLVRIRANSEGAKPAAVEKQGMGKFFDEKAKAAVLARYNTLAAHNIAHFPNPQRGDAARSQMVKDAGPGAHGAGASYRQNHATALLIAAAIGQSKAGARRPHARQFGAGEGNDQLNDALLIEAFADHFLTDAFSAGHQQTERASIKEYWDARIPNFWKNFQIWLADQLVLHARAGARLAPQWAREQISLPKVGEAVVKIPPLGFGDIVSGAIHAYYNRYGAQADVAGRRITLVGDANLLTKAVPNASLPEKEREFQPKDDQLRHVTDKSKDTFDAATAAVKAGIAEVYEAYDLGRQGEDPESVPDKILRARSGAFAAEHLLPLLASDATVTDPRQRSINPYLGSYADVLADARLAEGLVISLNSYADVVSDSLAGLGASEADAVNAVLIFRMKGDERSVVRLLREVISWTPLSGGGFNPDLLPDLNDVRTSTPQLR